MIFTVAVIGATLAVAALPNALSVLTGDMDQYRKAVESNLSLSGDSNQLKDDLKKLKQAIRWSIVLVAAQFLIVLILAALAIGPQHILAFANALLKNLTSWNAAAVNAVTPLVEASKDLFDRLMVWLCAVVAAVLLYWRGWRPLSKGRDTAREATSTSAPLRPH
jgi:hypothetical protein